MTTMMRPNYSILTALGAILLMLASAVHAQDQNREREALRRMQQQLGKAQQDSARTAQEKAEVEQKLKAAQDDLDKAKKQAGNAKKSAGAIAAARRENADLKSRLAALESSSKEAQQKAQAEIANLRQQLTETQRAFSAARQEAQVQTANLQGALDGETQRAQSCETKNRQLYSVTNDLIKRYKQNRGTWEKFLLSEPFTQLKRVEVENLLEDMRERAADSVVDQNGDAEAGVKAAAASGSKQ